MAANERRWTQIRLKDCSRPFALIRVHLRQFSASLRLRGFSIESSKSLTEEIS
jgi:hypothetical protein